MKRIALISLLIGCGTPKSDDDSGCDGAADAGASTMGGGEEAGDDGTTDAGDGGSDGGSDDGDTDGGDAEGGGSDGADTGGESGDSGSGDTNGDGTDGSATGGDDGGDSGSSGTTGGGSDSECLVDVLNFSATISDSDGTCSSPCDADDVLSYHLVIENESLSDCVLTTSSTCLIENVEISVAGPHGDVTETYTPMCGEALSVHDIPAGATVNESLNGGTLDPGSYIAIINVYMYGGLAYGSASFTVE